MTPFNSENAAEYGRKGGTNSRKNPDGVRSKQVLLVVTPSEFAMMDAKAAEEGVSRVEMIVRAVKKYKPKKYF